MSAQLHVGSSEVVAHPTQSRALFVPERNEQEIALKYKFDQHDEDIVSLQNQESDAPSQEQFNETQWVVCMLCVLRLWVDSHASLKHTFLAFSIKQCYDCQSTGLEETVVNLCAAMCGWDKQL